jgi:bidirectional [NiFe] hydrogenase diaphorase subunit
MLETHMKRHQFRQDALIEVLHRAQELFGYLDEGLLYFIAHNLKLPPSRVYGVATFYHFFNLKPKGAHTCVVCMGTACYVKGADKILAALEHYTGVKAGQTTPDGKVSITSARCIGACGLAPAVVYDGEVAARQTPEQALAKVKGWVGHGA